MIYGAMNFPVMPVLSELEAIAELGFDYLELAMDPPQAHYGIIHKQRDDLLRALDRRNLRVICHLPTFVSTADLTETIRESSLNEVIRSLEVAADFQPLKVVLHPSYMVGLSVFVMDRVIQYALKTLEVIVERAGELGLSICIENMFPQSNSLVDPEDFVEIFKRFPALNLTLDTGHAHIAGKGGDKNLDFIERFHDRLGHVHVNDNLGREDNHLPLGTGTVDFPKIIKALKAIGYDKTVTFEVFSRDRDYLKISREKFSTMFAAA
jgi:sugar phosphate isomerase/epimerase